MRKIVSRPNLAIPDLPLPVYIRSSGYNEAEYGWEEYESNKPFVQIFWCIQGAGKFILSEKEIILNPGETFFHLPGEIHHHISCDPGSPWRYYWFTFDGSTAKEFMLAYGYERSNIYSGECPVELFLELEMLLRKSSNYSRRHALSVAGEILALMGGVDEMWSPPENLIRRALKLIRTHLRTPDITVEEIARQLGVHRTTLNSHFRRGMGISPGEHLNNLRLEHALKLLRNSTLSMKEVAEHSGFMNQSYFCKLIRNACGMTPKEYRNSSIKQTE